MPANPLLTHPVPHHSESWYAYSFSIQPNSDDILLLDINNFTNYNMIVHTAFDHVRPSR
jgi:hypothetical protein